jgi:uncharacterized membrane protein YcfT
MTSDGTSAVAGKSGAAGADRVDWVDYAKGICIVMVVMMHSVLGVELAAGHTGFMHLAVEFAKPFRMPDFFMISGLFLPLVIDRDWRSYLDRKVVHFAYFYVLWVTIQFGFKAPAFANETSWAHASYLYLESFIEPFGTLWFIYELPIFFVVTKATRRLPPPLIWGCAALLEMAHCSTGWTAIDEFGARFVYFYTGYWLADYVFALSAQMRRRPAHAAVALAVWAIANEVLVKSGLSEMPVISLTLGVAGACAVVTLATLLARANWIDFIRFCGEHSIVIYLAFFLPMAATRTLLLHVHLVDDVGVMSLIVTVVALFGALAIWQIALKVGANFLFERPGAFWIAPKKTRATLQAAE